MDDPLVVGDHSSVVVLEAVVMFTKMAVVLMNSTAVGLLHISNITRARVTSVSDLLTVDEKVKVMVVKSMFPNKIALRMGMNPPDESFITCIIDVCGSYIPSPHTTTTKRTLPPPPTPFVIADLESEPGLFLSNKEKVFSDAEEMAKKYRQKLPAVTATRKLEPLPTDALPFHDEASLYANWRWFKFERDDGPN
ncbi:hypothetical protein CK203_081646 [Vitis vinifera]|uniref:Uncharacterized protein n=1 Tax=Vitis vinifera TaxID=29760 RepID=A0A438DPI8_VITVI|nr:hypothetical protein CK203_081646 [Vitis vinifera]